MVFIGAAFLAVYFMAYPRTFSGPQTFTSPRANIGYVLAQRFAHGFGFRFPLKHYHDLPTDIARALTPRDAAELNGGVVPKDFAGTMFLYGLLFAAWKPLVLVASPLFGVLGAFVLAKIGEELFDRSVGLGAFLLWLVHPVLLRNASFIVESDTIALVGILSGFLYFCRYWRAGQRWDLLAMNVSFGFAILMRYPNVLVVVPLSLALLFARRLRWREGILAVMALAPFAATILVFNRLTYGDVAVTGYGLGGRLLAMTVSPSAHSLFQLHLGIAAGYLRLYLLKWPIVLVPPALGLFSGIYIAWRVVRLRFVILALLASTMALALYYLPMNAYGAMQPVINASVLRYLMPALALWTVFFVRGLYQLTGRRRLVVGAALIAMVASSLWTSWSVAGGVRSTRTSVANLTLFRQHVLAATEPDSIVASAIMDKVVFPARQTLTIAYLAPRAETIKGISEDIWYSFPRPNRFAEVAVRIHQRGIPLYILLPADSSLAQLYGPALREVGLRLRHVWKVSVNFFEVVPLRRKT